MGEALKQGCGLTLWCVYPYVFRSHLSFSSRMFQYPQLAYRDLKLRPGHMGGQAHLLAAGRLFPLRSFLLVF